MRPRKFVEFPHSDLMASIERIATHTPGSELAEHRELIVGSLRNDIAQTREMIREAMESLPAEIFEVYGRVFEQQLVTAEGIIARLTQVAEVASRAAAGAMSDCLQAEPAS